MTLLYALILLLIVAAFVSAPLWSGRSTDQGEDPVMAEIEAAKEAKYREIQDLELDRAAEKLDEEEYRRQRTKLRREAADILVRERAATESGRAASARSSSGDLAEQGEGEASRPGSAGP